MITLFAKLDMMREQVVLDVKLVESLLNMCVKVPLKGCLWKAVKDMKAGKMMYTSDVSDVHAIISLKVDAWLLKVAKLHCIFSK